MFPEQMHGCVDGLPVIRAFVSRGTFSGLGQSVVLTERRSGLWRVMLDEHNARATLLRPGYRTDQH
jgi:hypothetical protein|eukprot:1820679-Prymnesium_polylepis.1